MAQRPRKGAPVASGDTPMASRGTGPGRVLILVVRPALALQANARGIVSKAGANVATLNSVLAAASASIRPLFGQTEERLQATAASMSAAGAADVPDLSVYYRVDAPQDQLDSLAEQLRSLDTVDGAYVKPAVEPPVLFAEALPLAEEPPAATPDFGSRQGYLEAAPGGVDARYAWTRPGGAGAGVSIIDVEGEWRFTHEDMTQNQGGVVGGTPPGSLLWRNHGTAVAGVFGADSNSIGVKGICPDANVRAISVFGLDQQSSEAIHKAADLLNPGDVILIELHAPGPRFNFELRDDQLGFIAVEWWPDDFDAIRYATARGVVVVEAAGNGAENLDDAIYNTPGAGFPSGWSNPFRRGARDSGAILVGAGAPPPGTHGANHGNDRSRLDFSNYGSAVDAQGWGREVTTTGYGDLQGGSNEDLWYTDRFSGTSSASPIVVGAVASVQGFLRAGGKPPLTPAAMRALLRRTGSPQQDGPSGPASQRIGNRPNLRQMIDSLSPQPTARVPLYRYWNQSNGDHFYTTDWNELGSGRHGWKYEHIQAYVHAAATPGALPLYRYWNTTVADHFYTTNWSELGSGAHGWVYERIQCYVFPSQVSGSVALHRYWNSALGDHFYTTNWNELGGGAHGWRYERVQCYVFPTLVSSGPQAPDQESDAGTPSSFTTTAADTEVPATFSTTAAVDDASASFATKAKGAGTPEASFATEAARDAAIQVTLRIER